MGSMIRRSLVLLLSLAFISFFKTAATYPHLEFGMERTPLDGPESIAHDRLNHSKRQDGNAWTSKPSFISPPGLLHCEPSPTGEYYDSHRRRVKEASDFFCDHFANSEERDLTMAPIAREVYVKTHTIEYLNWDWPTVANDIEEWYGSNVKRADVYAFNVEVVEGCIPKGEKVNLARPVKHHKCRYILYDAWKHCNNKGRGGSLQAGCLKYSIRTKF